MQRLRTQVDRIDRQILRLLRQRTSLSRRIGEAKRRHRAVIYVPERERELLRRVARLSRGGPSPRAVVAIFREILSSSRAEQGQAAIGLLRSSSDAILPAARWCFGACDEFRPVQAWPGLVRGLENGSLALVLLTGRDLQELLQKPAHRRDFPRKWQVAGDLPGSAKPNAPLKERIFIVIPRGPSAPQAGNRLLILIECKTAANALKRRSMPEYPFQAETAAPLRGQRLALAQLAFAKPVSAIQAGQSLKDAGIAGSILGLYPGSEDYGG
jgi:chorismate mutase